MAEDIAVTVEHVSKDFILPHEKAAKLKDLFTSAFRKRSKGRDVHHALRDVSFEVKKGEFFGIVGRNGSGKSTMLKMLAGIYQPTKGKLRVQGKLVPFIELGVGFNPELTGRENVFLNGAMMGFSKKETAAMYDDIVAFAELEDFMDQKLKNYSSGMQVRLAFSVAIKAEADVLLVDEVLAVGDTDFQRKCYEYFKSLKKAKKTVVFVSHDMSAVREYCDRAALIEGNVVKAIGKSYQVADKYDRLFVEDQSEESNFVSDNRWGTGAVNAVDVRLAKSSLNSEKDALELTVTLEANEQLTTEYGSFTSGFRVFNEAGQCLHESNTWAEGMEMPLLKPGERCTVRWRCENVYVAGRYTVGVFTNANGKVADSWDGVVQFSVRRQLHRGVLLELPVTVNIRHEA